jgi:prepilin-type N-terminal cleavage/methylation domain-containing protein
MCIRRLLNRKGFTLIELLIVIAIILILISIALPNFLEAQLRAKVVKVKGEMRGLGEATGAYYNDWKIDPNVDNMIKTEANRSRIWWGYASHRLTTPTNYIKKIPVDPFPDSEKTLLWGWTGIDAKNGIWNAPYLVVVRVRTTTPQAELWHFRPFGNSACPNVGGMDPMTWQALGTAPWVYFSAGPDLSATLTYLAVGGKVFASYNPTNGTQSKGDIWTGGY